MRRYPQVGFSAARRSASRRGSADVDGRPGGRCGWVQCRAMRRRCQRNSVSGVTSHPARLGRGSAAAIAASKVRSVSVSSGRSTWRRNTASWWRNTIISRFFERPDRTVSRASDARNRYKIRYTRIQDRPSSLQVNAHDRVFGTPQPRFKGSSQHCLGGRSVGARWGHSANRVLGVGLSEHQSAPRPLTAAPWRWLSRSSRSRGSLGDGGGQRLGSRIPLCPCCVDVGAEVSELVQDVVVAAF